MIVQVFKEWWEDIVDNTRDVYYAIRRKLSTVSAFIRHGWQFRNIRYYDGAYIYETLEIMLSNFIAAHTKWNRTIGYVGQDRDIKRMKVCRQLANRLAKGDYATLYDAQASVELDKWWSNRAEMITESGTRVMTFPTAESHRALDRQRKKQEVLRAADKELLFKLLSVHIDTWWY